MIIKNYYIYDDDVWATLYDGLQIKMTAPLLEILSTEYYFRISNYKEALGRYRELNRQIRDRIVGDLEEEHCIQCVTLKPI